MDKKNRNILSFLFITFCVVIPWSVAAMQILLGLICLHFILYSIVTKQNLFKFNHFYIFPAAYLLTLILSAAISKDPVIAFDNVLHTYWVILTLPIIASLPLSQPVRYKAINALIISASVVGAYAVIQFFSGLNLISDTPISKLGNFYRGVGTYSHFLTFAGNQLMIFAFVFVLVIQSNKNTQKTWWYVAALTIIGFSMVATQARSSWLGIAVIVFIGTYLYYRKHFWKIMVAFAALALIVIIALPDIRERVLAIFNVTHLHNQGRLNLWKTSLLIIKDYFIIGIGPGLFHQYFEIYKVPGFYNAIGHPHNDLIHVFVQTGIIGVITWLSIWVAYFRLSLQYIKQNASDSSDILIIKGSTLAIAGILFASLFQCYFVDLENSILWWLIIGICLQVINKSEQEKT